MTMFLQLRVNKYHENLQIKPILMDFFFIEYWPIEWQENVYVMTKDINFSVIP